MPTDKQRKINRSPAIDINDAQWSQYEDLGLQPFAADDIRRTIAAMVEHAGCFLPEDFFRALRFGLDREVSESGKGIYRLLLKNAIAAAEARRPACQDTGQAVVFADIGQDARIVGGDLEQAVNEGVVEGYGSFRGSVVKDALFDRKNTGDNSPAILHTRIVPGNDIVLHVAEKGYGSENKSFMTMYPYPQGGQEAVVKYVLENVEKAGADWCPPGVISVAVGGNFEEAPLMAKRALLEPFDMDLLLERAKSNPESLTDNDKLRIRLFEEINAIGIGPQGLGGVTTVLDVKLQTAPTHIAGMPIAVNVQCNKAHHISIRLDGSGPVLDMPKADFALYAAGLDEDSGPMRRVNVPMDEETRRSLRAGERLLLNGRILTGRDAAHKRLIDTLDRGEKLPVDLTGHFIYFVGPIDPQPGEVVGPAGPTTSSRMDPYTPRLLREAGLAGSIGKSERGQVVVDAMKETGTVYMIATGGAGYLQSRTIKGVEILAYEDLGTEAIRAFDVEDFPVVVAADSTGENLHRTGREKYGKIKKEGITF